MNLDFSLLVLYLAAYSMMGWICEVIYCSVPAKHFINRGFLNGPYCPIYGFGAVFILAVTGPVIQYPLLVFVLSICTATILEYFTSWLMETVFQTRWWDYSNYKFNVKGRICPLNSLLFGIGGIAVTYYLHPFVQSVMESISGEKQRVLASVVIMVFLIDMFYTLNSLLKLNERLATLKSYLSEIERYNTQYAWLDRNDISGSISRLKEISQKDVNNEDLANILVRLENMMAKREWEFRLIKSFPNMKPKGLETLLVDLRSTWEQRKEMMEVQKETLTWRIWNATKHWSRQTAIAKETSGFFAQGRGFYKLIWVFVGASVLGFAVETGFNVITTGTIESRQGMIYGPFNQVYGFGAILLVLILTPLSKKSDRWLFFGSAVIGGVFEFLSNLFYGWVFDAGSWQIGADAYSIGGRTSLTHMFFWGILGLWFIRGIYPKLSGLIEQLPSRQGFIFSWLLIITVTANLFLSGTAVYRWSERLEGSPPANAYEAFLDRQYPDETLEEIYPTIFK